MNEYDIKIALGGNPNVGKSTLFNQLTGMHQHTGNWTGKTVKTAEGICKFGKKRIKTVDLPGTYSLRCDSQEEEVARDFICFSDCDYIVMVCDATALERTLNLCLQTLQMCRNVIVAVNFCDEAEKAGIKIDFIKLSQILNCPAVPINARKKKGIDQLLKECLKPCKNKATAIKHPRETEEVIDKICRELVSYDLKHINARWIALKIIENDVDFINRMQAHLNISLKSIIDKFKQDIRLLSPIITEQQQKCVILFAEYTVGKVCTILNKKPHFNTDRIDKAVTGKITGTALMLLLLFGVFWLTVKGANYPSEILAKYLFLFEEKLAEICKNTGMPTVIIGVFVHGGIRVLCWVVSVMLPPMVIFFPLFTVLENLGYLPRIAFNLDSHFQRANTCGKQALSMCMGFGCNAVGVTGCRIITSERERAVASVTNAFMPCNGKFPALIAVLTMFFTAHLAQPFCDILVATSLIMLIVLAVFITFITSKILSKTVFCGNGSSFILELPPYRKPQFAKIAIRSIFDRTFFVLMRAAAVALPAGMVIWLLSNISIYGTPLINILSDALNPFGKLLGLDGGILLAFILGFPANEIVIPIIMMIYKSNGILNNYSDLSSLYSLFVANGWEIRTAVCYIIFTLFHWPCSTTVITVYKETRSFKKAIISFLLPTVIGVALCITANMLMSIIK